MLVTITEKAFLKIEINPFDRNVARILWLKVSNKPSTQDNLPICRFKKLLFGIICSLFILAAVLKRVYKILHLLEQIISYRIHI